MSMNTYSLLDFLRKKNWKKKERKKNWKKKERKKNHLLEF